MPLLAVKERYSPYQPTRLESRVDNVIRLLSPRWQVSRVANREKENYFRYLTAYPTSSRRNSNQTTSGETFKGSREKLQVMWNAINAVDNSGLCTSIVTKFQMYVCGTLRWQSRCGDRGVSNEYEDYMRIKLGASLDATGRLSLRQMAMLDIRSILIKGDVGTNIVRDGNEIYLQGIEADRIGNPSDATISNNYVRGLVLDDYGAITAAKIYTRQRSSGVYVYEDTIPFRDSRGMPRFLFLVNPISYDDYRGISAFKTAIDNATYIDRIREYELQALLWAASQSGVYHTKSGALPDALPFDRINPLVDISGNPIETYQVRPNTVTALGVGEDVTMFQHDRPSPNVLGILKETVRDIAVGTGLSFGMVWDMSGYTGPAVRAISSQDARTIEIWQWLIREGKLDPVAMLVLGNGIANKEIQYHPNWMKWEWFFPAKSTIDVGRESQANIEEINAGINTGARVAADDGMDIDEIQQQRGREVEAMIEVAQTVADSVSKTGQPVPWQQVYALMCPQPGKGGGMGMGMMPGAASPDGEGATTDGAEIDGGRNGKSKMRQQRETIVLRQGKDGMEILVPDHVWYRADQARDDHGRFADEGGGAAPAGKSGDGNGKEEKPVAETPPTPPKTRITSENVESTRGKVDSSELAKHKDEIGSAFKMDDKTKIVPIESLISHKDESRDPGFVAGTKGDPRQRATDKMLATTRGGGGEPRVPLDVHDNGDGTYAIKDGNATAQAAMLAGWTKLPVHITSETDAPMSPLDRKLVDYKPGERPLNDPTKTERLDDIVPNSRFVPYTKTKFFDAVSQMQGTDPNKVTGQEYKLARDKLMNKMPVENVPIDRIVVTQRGVNRDKIASISKWPKGYGAGGTKLKPIQVVRYRGETYILNGHHRLAVYKMRGDDTVRAHVLDFGDHLPTAGEIDAIQRSTQGEPEHAKTLNEVAAAHDAVAVHAPFKRLAGKGGIRDKAMSDYGGDITQVKDILRGRIVTKDTANMHAAAQDLTKRLGIAGKYSKTPEGYEDYKFTPTIAGRKTEIGVMTEPMQKASNEGHPHYKEKQYIIRNANNEKRPLTPNELSKVATLDNKMKELFSKAGT